MTQIVTTSKNDSMTPIIHQKSLERIRASSISPDVIAQTFEHLAEAAAICQTDAQVSFSVHWQQPDEEVPEGTLVPTLTFTLAPASLIRKEDNEPKEADKATQ